MKKITIAILTQNGKDLVNNVLESLTKTVKKDIADIILIDNLSQDGTIELKEKFYNVNFIILPERMCFSKAYNYVFKKVETQYYLLLNNDIITKANWLEPLLDTIASNKKIGAVAPKLLYPDETIQHAGIAIAPNSLPSLLYRGFPKNFSKASYERKVKAVTAAAMLTSREIYWEVEGLDEKYKFGFEDVDYCFKLNEKSYECIYQPKSEIIHFEEKTPGRKKYDNENINYFLKKWKGKIVSDLKDILDKDGFILSLKEPDKYQLLDKEETNKLLLKAEKLISENNFIESLKIYIELLKTSPFLLSALKGGYYCADKLNLKQYLLPLKESIILAKKYN